MPDLHGLLTALVTPFTPDGESVDEPALRALVDDNISAGAHGLVPCGSTGEFAAMTHDERRSVVAIVADQAAGRVPVAAHTAAMTTKEAVALSRHAEEVGAAAVMVVSPYYEPLTYDEIASYYRAIAEAISIDIMIYNLPLATGVNLQPEQIAELATEIPNVKYVKDTSGDFNQALRLIYGYSDVITTFVGLDTLYFTSLVEGAGGSVNGAGNFLAPELVSIYDSVKSGDIPAASKVWQDVYPVMEFLCAAGYTAGVKGAMDLVGRSAGDPRHPMARLGAGRSAELKQLLQAFPNAAKA